MSGYMADKPDDPLLIVPGGQIDRKMISGTITRAQREDLQQWSCLCQLASIGALEHPISSAPGGDPPDRVWTIGDRSWGVELTELTIQEFRSGLARVRSVSRVVQRLIDEEPDRFVHLQERVVSVGDSNASASHFTTRNFSLVAEQIRDAVAEDRGCLQDNFDGIPPGDDGLPREIPYTHGRYGDIGGLVVAVDRGALGSSPTVVAGASFQLLASEVRDRLVERLKDKDRPGNDIVILTTGLPDSNGYTCPLDKWLFDMVFQHNLGSSLKLDHISGVLMHNWGTPFIGQIYRRPDADLPWSPPPGP
ncbi:hypothetical protein [Lentzea waywayandensis]|nr:hypothetical protein [Lentzea waywayandensis]